VGYVTMELVHKDSNYEGPIKPYDIRRWPPKAVQFLPMTESAYSIDELTKVEKYLLFTAHLLTSLKHSLFNYEWQEDDWKQIKANVYAAELSVVRTHDIIPQRRQ
jgi:hypothetical protein